MPQLTSPEGLDHVLHLVAQHPKGLSVNALCVAMGDVPRRTLQRRLAALVQANRAALVGRGRAARYVVVSPQQGPPALPIPVLSVQEPGADYPTEAYVPTSPEGEAIKTYVLKNRRLGCVKFEVISSHFLSADRTFLLLRR